MKTLLVLCLVLSSLSEVKSDEDAKNPLTILDYGDVAEITWYGWFVIIYSFLVVVVIGSAVFLP